MAPKGKLPAAFHTLPISSSVSTRSRGTSPRLGSVPATGFSRDGIRASAIAHLKKRLERGAHLVRNGGASRPIVALHFTEQRDDITMGNRCDLPDAPSAGDMLTQEIGGVDT